MLFFALNGSQTLGARVAAAGGFVVAAHEERDFQGGEHKSRPLVSVRGRDVFVLHSLHGDGVASANDKLVRLLFFLATCREHGAARVTAIVPYLAYSRKDRQTKPQDPVSSRYVAQLLEAVGVELVMTFEVHNLAAFQNAFRCRTVHLATQDFFAAHIAAQNLEARLAVVSPDAGGVKRAQLLREALEARIDGEVSFGFMEKRRSAGLVSGSLFAGEVKDRVVYIVDDMICGGGTVLRAARAVRDHGGRSIHVLAPHGLLEAQTFQDFCASDVIDSVTVTDSVAPLAHLPAEPPDWFRILGCAPLIADAIDAVHRGQEISLSVACAPELVDNRQ